VAAARVGAAVPTHDGASAAAPAPGRARRSRAIAERHWTNGTVRGEDPLIGFTIVG
jgi:hypothetical protein